MVIPNEQAVNLLTVETDREWVQFLLILCFEWSFRIKRVYKCIHSSNSWLTDRSKQTSGFKIWFLDDFIDLLVILTGLQRNAVTDQSFTMVSQSRDGQSKTVIMTFGLQDCGTRQSSVSSHGPQVEDNAAKQFPQKFDGIQSSKFTTELNTLQTRFKINWRLSLFSLIVDWWPDSERTPHIPWKAFRPRSVTWGQQRISKHVIHHLGFTKWSNS